MCFAAEIEMSSQPSANVGIKPTTRRPLIFKYQICPQSPSVSFLAVLSSSLNATPDSVHMFCLFKNTCFLLSFPRALCLSFSRFHPSSFLPTFSLHDLCPTLTFTPFLWLFSGTLVIFLAVFSRQRRIWKDCFVFMGEWEREGWKQRESEEGRRERMKLMFVGS